MKVRIPIFLSLAFLSGAVDHASAVEFQFGNFTCDDLGTTISIIDYPNDAAGPVVIPQSIERGGIQKPVTAIEVVAFDDSVGITSVTIPSSVTSVGSDAFARCTALTSVTLPSSLTSIGANAFRDCSALTGITLPIGLNVIEESLFEGCSSLTSLVIPQGVTIIGLRAFALCSGLISVNLPLSVTLIGEAAFTECAALESITLPAGLTAIDVSTFDNCDSLTSVTIPSSVSNIEKYAFFDCDSLKNVTIPASVTTVGQEAFSEGALLTYVFFMGNAPTMGDSVFDNLTTNGNLRIYIFSGKTGFTQPGAPLPVPPISQYWQPLETQPAFFYACINMGSENPLTPWLILNNLPINSNLQDDANGDGVNLLMAYALNLDPSENLSGSLPQPVLGDNLLSMSFYAGSPGIMYRVETCTDLMSWTDVGVVLTLPDPFQVITASVDLSGSQRFMRLVVEK
jgi:hypothetical protein